MRTYTARVRVEPKHLDAGDHVNGLAQLKIAEDVHFALRDEVGLGLECLQLQHGLFLVMGRIYEVAYHRQLRLDELIEVRLTMWAARATCFDFTADFFLDDRCASTMRWTMPLVSTSNGRICRIPAWMFEIVGAETN